MIYTKRNLEVVAATKKDGRPFCGKVFFAPDGSTIATDGALLFRVSASGVSSDEFPVVDDSYEPVVFKDKGILIFADGIKTVAKNIDSKAMLPILRCCQLVRDKAKKPRLITTDLGGATAVFGEDKDGGEFDDSYPDYQIQLDKVNNQEDAKSVEFNIHVLGRLVAFVKRCGGENLSLRIVSEDVAVYFSFEVFSGTEHQVVDGLIAPMLTKRD